MRYFDIIHEDPSFIVLHKFPRVLSIPDRFDPNKPNLYDLLLLNRSEIYVVHRLDYETSGVMLFAKNKEAHKIFSTQFEQRSLVKKYWSLSVSPKASSGTIDAPIREHPSRRGYYEVHDKGKKAVTHYKTLETFGPFSLIELLLETGRTHQIRVHLKHIGAPLLVDKKYGLREDFKLSEIKRKYRISDRGERPLLSRSSLHARSIAFDEPVSRKLLTFTAPLPKDMKAALNQMRKIFN